MSTAELSVSLVEPEFGAKSFSRFHYYFWSPDVAMDLGTANTLIYVKKRGVVLNEPSLLAIEEESGKTVAVGRAAREKFGKTSKSIKCLRPMKDGVIADFDYTTIMIDYMLSKIKQRWSLRKPRVVIGVPSGITQVEKKAVMEAARCSGMSEVFLAEEPMAAALGAGLPVDRAMGNMIVDIGGGTTEVAVISMNGTLYSHSIRVAGDEMDEGIQRSIRKNFGVEVGIFDAEKVKIILGSALPTVHRRTISLYGRDIATGFPKQIEVSDELVRDAMHEPISAIISSVVTALEQTTPEIAHDILLKGVHLAGGGSLLKGLPERLSRETGISFHRTHDPLSCVVRGVGKIIDNLKDLKVLCIA